MDKMKKDVGRARRPSRGKRASGPAAALCHLFAAIYVAAVAAHAAAVPDAPPDLSGFPQGEDVCISLRGLAERAWAAQAAGRAPEAGDAALSGAGWLYCYVADPQNKDIVLVGRRCEHRPALHIDDVAALFRNVLTKDTPPYCSLDPLPEYVLKLDGVMAGLSLSGSGDVKRVLKQVQDAVGPQKTVVGGVHRDARLAHVMIEADYHMKKVSQGHIQVPGVTSTPDYMIAQAEAAVSAGKEPPSAGASQSRFWFQMREDPGISFRMDGGVYWLESCPVSLLTERQRSTADGELYDSGESDPDADRFAAEMSAHFAEAAHSIPIYADLEHLYRLRALCSAMRQQGDISRSGVDVGYFLERHRWMADKPMPDALPGLANVKDWEKTVESGNMQYRFFVAPVVCGGVSLDTPVQAASFHNDDGGYLAQFGKMVLASRPAGSPASWELPKSVLSDAAKGARAGSNGQARRPQAAPVGAVQTEAPPPSPAGMPSYMRRAVQHPLGKF